MAIVLDYDGVIVDSMNENLFVSFNAYSGLAETKLLNGKKLSFEEFDDSLKRKNKIFSLFKKRRLFISAPLDLFYVWKSIEEDLGIQSQKQFDSFLKKKFPESKNFVECLYALRNHYIQNSFEKWRLLTPVYRHMRKFLEVNSGKFFISTTNRKFTIKAVLGSYGFPIDDSMAIDNTSGNDKNSHLANIKDNLKINFSDIAFVDDQVDHLLKAKKLGVDCYLTGWGFNNEEQKNAARKNGIKVISTMDEIQNKVTSS